MQETPQYRVRLSEKMNSLSDKLEKLKTLQSETELQLEEKDISEEIAAQTHYHEEVENFIYTVRNELGVLSSGSVSEHNDTSYGGIKRLPKFGGKQEEWLDFWEPFMQLVDSDPDYSEVEKMLTLRNHYV